MPLLSSTFTARGLFRNPHFSTIYSAKVRRVRGVSQERERFELPDGDFLDVDWSFFEHTLSRKRTKNLALLFHGLEGNAQRSYMLAMAKKLNQNGYDVAAVNFRGCSGSRNRLFRSYHSGDTGDIRFLVNTLINRDAYKNVVLYGVSLGGNAVLKYLGEPDEKPEALKAVVTVGVPSDLKASLEQLTYTENIVYRTSFLVDLRRKYKLKMPEFPDQMTSERYAKINSLKDFDDIYTAPAHGFKDALDYYAKASSYAYLPDIKIPTLILNAKNDSFLHGKCFPYSVAQDSKTLFLETPQYGGHVGFYLSGDFYYNEERAMRFFTENVD